MKGPDSHSYARIPFPTTADLPSSREDKSVVPSSPDDTPFDASIHYNAFSKYLASYSAKEPEDSRPAPRQRLTKLTHQQFQELCTDVHDELVRRNTNSDATRVAVLPAQGKFHPKRNQARQKLATLTTSRFPELVIDVHYELGCRYPECKESH
ncbi:hypothetical protein BJV74DRAFT_856306 [Russula compacta]|nr:hypothetical protein BJV74DRAFT_856306 [Russula compacta]